MNVDSGTIFWKVELEIYIGFLSGGNERSRTTGERDRKNIAGAAVSVSHPRAHRGTKNNISSCTLARKREAWVTKESIIAQSMIEIYFYIPCLENMMNRKVPFASRRPAVQALQDESSCANSR